MKLASHLHMSLRRCKRETSSSEFVRWRVFLENELSTPTPDQWYLIALRATIANVFGSGGSINLYDYVLPFNRVNNRDVPDYIKRIVEKHGKTMKDMEDPVKLLAFYESLDYKKNPIPEEQLSDNDKLRMAMSKTYVQHILRKARNRKTPVKTSPDGKVVKTSTGYQVPRVSKEHGVVLDHPKRNLRPAAFIPGIPKKK